MGEQASIQGLHPLSTQGKTHLALQVEEEEG
jgi:hypothetical protein